LLAIEPGRRNSPVFAGLIWTLYTHARDHGYTHLFISGVEDRLDLYGHIGFLPLGPAVPGGGAPFVPPMGAVEELPEQHARLLELGARHRERQPPGPGQPVCLLPGPVSVAPAVREAFRQPPLYHRGPEFIALLEAVRRQLGEMVGGRDVAVVNGSGTLANEM